MSTPPAAGLAKPIQPIAPVTPRERIEIIDILRGWALFGILVVNMTNDAWHVLPWTGTANRAVYHLVEIFAQEKFYTLFSFLFGLGFALQMGRAESRGVRFGRIYCRRLLGLYLIGLIQTLLVGDGQLCTYAILGFLLLLFWRCSPRTILIAAVLCLLIAPVHDAVTSAIREHRLASPQTARQVIQQEAQQQREDRQWEDENVRVHSSGSFAEITAWHAPRIVRPHLRFPWIHSWWAFAMEFPLLLLGLYAGRRHLFDNLAAHLPLVRKVMWWGLGLGLTGCVLHHLFSQFNEPPWPYPTLQLTRLLWSFGAPALCFSYASAIVLLAQQPAWQIRLAPLAAVGRLALSNYVFHWVVDMLLLYSYGLRFFGKLEPVAGLAVAFLIFPLQVIVSRWWVRRFRFGPAEWLWRSLTYGQLQPMRAGAVAA